MDIVLLMVFSVELANKNNLFKLVSCQWLGILLLTPESFLGAGPAPLPSDSCALIITPGSPILN